MDQAITIFINGIAGVFVGMTILYAAMKLIALISAKLPESTPESG